MPGYKHNLIYQIERIISIKIIRSCQKERWVSLEEVIQATSFDRPSRVNHLLTLATTGYNQPTTL